MLSNVRALAASLVMITVLAQPASAATKATVNVAPERPRVTCTLTAHALETQFPMTTSSPSQDAHMAIGLYKASGSQWKWVKWVLQSGTDDYYLRQPSSIAGFDVWYWFTGAGSFNEIVPTPATNDMAWYLLAYSIHWADGQSWPVLIYSNPVWC